MKMKHLFYLLLIFTITACGNSSAENEKDSSQASEISENSSDFKYWTWITVNPERSNESYSEEFRKYKDNGIEAVLSNTETDAELLSKLAPLAKEEGLEVHAWM